MLIIVSFYVILSAIYCHIIISYILAIIRVKIYKPQNLVDTTNISIIIALRNEELNIERLLSSLKKIMYPLANFEVILVDDHSTDNTYSHLKQSCKKFSNYKLLSLSPEKQGKKEAVKLGVQNAKGELCIFTDADCYIPAELLNYYSSLYLEKNKPEMITGLVDMPVKNKNIMQEMFRMEFLSLILCSTGATLKKQPVFCNAANMAIQKAAFEKHATLNTRYTSGDDVFLLHSVKRKNKRILMLLSPDTIVRTQPPATFREFIIQRARWASKAGGYSDRDSILLALIVLGQNLSLVVLLFSTQITIYYIIVGMTSKSLVDFCLFHVCGKKITPVKKLYLIPLIEVMYPFYIITAAIASIKKPFQWKGRQIS